MGQQVGKDLTAAGTIRAREARGGKRSSGSNLAKNCYDPEWRESVDDRPTWGRS